MFLLNIQLFMYFGVPKKKNLMKQLPNIINIVIIIQLIR